jgi:hypothetical protein
VVTSLFCEIDNVTFIAIRIGVYALAAEKSDLLLN